MTRPRASRIRRWAFALLSFSFLLASCQPNASATPALTPAPGTSAATAHPTPTARQAQTRTPSPVPTFEPTLTPPARATRTPDATPTPSPTQHIAAPSPTPTRDTGIALAIPSHKRASTGGGQVYIVGLVRNVSEHNLAWVKVQGRFYGTGGEVLATSDTYAYIDILRPGEEALFELRLQGMRTALGDPVQIDHYTLTAHGTETLDEPFLGVQFVQHAALLDPGDTLTLIGEVTNEAERPMSQVRVAGAVYDAGGQILGVGFTYAEKSVLEPNQVAPFKIQIRDIDGIPEDYQIIAYGQQATDRDLARQVEIEIRSLNHRREGSASLSLLGEVENGDAGSARFIHVFASLYNSDGALVGVGSSYVWRDVLEPRARSPFQITLLDPSPDVERWQVWAEGARMESEQARASRVGDLVLEDTTNSVDEKNVVAFAGRVRNPRASPCSNVQVGVTIYGAAGQVVAVKRVFLNGELAAGATLPFDLTAEALEEPTTFVLYAQGVFAE